jgi:aryl-alcohol dehydrogenase-like predicted oxidoreductase
MTETIELDELSPAGFGCYRVDGRSPVHRAALEQALAAGCTLVDTAASYADGRSEELVGATLESMELPAFVVTKAGYVSPSARRALQREGVRLDALPVLESGTPYSLDPKVLRVLLDLSRGRLRRARLDAVLLHNPERLLETGAPEDELSLALERAFAFLESEVAAGRLRYYGVSSNELPEAAPGHVLDLDTLLELAGSAFVLAEFPLNLLERAAATNAAGRPSLLIRAENRVRTLANRPLNAIVDGTKVRLAQTSSVAAEDTWEACVALVATRLGSVGEEQPWTSFRPMQFLRDNRHGIPDPDLVDEIWANQIEPFVAALFEDDPPDEVRAAFGSLRADARAHAQRTLGDGSRCALEGLVGEGLLAADSEEPLAHAACRFCLDAGADHVLVGMRRPEYVAQLASLFAYQGARW